MNCLNVIFKREWGGEKKMAETEFEKSLLPPSPPKKKEKIFFLEKFRTINFDRTF